jgi:hypothetical protein
VLTIACVLRSGGEYRPKHVMALRRAVAAHMPTPHRFLCLADMAPDGVWWTTLPHPYPGWWSKVNLFAPGLLSGRCLYLDLDSVVVGDLSDLAAYAGPFAMLTDFVRPERPASGVMAWDAGAEAPRAIWDAWMRDPEGHMHAHQGGGDQAFIRSVIGDGVDRLQDFLPPDYLCSYKVHVVPNGGVPDGCSIVAAHGRPKPWDAEWHL